MHAVLLGFVASVSKITKMVSVQLVCWLGSRRYYKSVIIGLF